jgi:hypothetical protein
MEWLWLVGGVVLVSALVWYPRRHRRTLEDALEDEQLLAERSRHRDQAIEMVDRMHTGGPNS